MSDSIPANLIIDGLEFPLDLVRKDDDSQFRGRLGSNYESPKKSGNWKTWPMVDLLTEGRVVVVTCDVQVFDSIDALPSKNLQADARKAEKVLERALKIRG